MKGTTILIAVIVLVVIAVVAYLALSNRSSLQPITYSSLSSSTATTTVNATTTINVTSTINTNLTQNRTVTASQVISALGTGWTSVTQFTNNMPSNITLANGTILMVNGYGFANFSNSGTYLTTAWTQFGSSSFAASYTNTTFRQSFPNATGVTTGTEGNATYMLYSGYSINKGQAASVLYAYDGGYSMTIFNRGTVVPNAQMLQLLADQLSQLGIS